MTKKSNIIKLLGKNKSKSMRKNILQISFGKLVEILTYKCADNGIYVKKVDPKNTSKRCSSCGKIKNNLQLSDRIFKCECGLEIERDYNACLNIVLKGVGSAG